MKKSRAVIALILTVVITALMAFTVLVGLGSGHRGSYHNIKLGLDLAGGASITYEAVGDEAPSAEDMADTVYKLQASKRPTRSWRSWDVPVLCILSDRQTRAERKTIRSVLMKTAITAMF